MLLFSLGFITNVYTMLHLSTVPLCLRLVYLIHFSRCFCIHTLSNAIVRSQHEVFRIKITKDKQLSLSRLSRFAKSNQGLRKINSILLFTRAKVLINRGCWLPTDRINKSTFLIIWPPTNQSESMATTSAKRKWFDIAAPFVPIPGHPLNALFPEIMADFPGILSPAN